jgi:hypothetical protein
MHKADSQAPTYKRQRLAAIAGAVVYVERRRRALTAHGLAQERQEVAKERLVLTAAAARVPVVRQ